MRAPVGIFETSTNTPTDQDRINGWSFVAPATQDIDQLNLMHKLK